MKKIVAQANLENIKEAYTYIKNQWIESVLSSIGINFGDTLNLNEERSVESRARLKHILADNRIHIEDNNEQVTISILNDKDWEVIAKLEKPIYTLKKDLKQKDKSKILYSEIEIEYFSVFDQEE